MRKPMGGREVKKKNWSQYLNPILLDPTPFILNSYVTTSAMEDPCPHQLTFHTQVLSHTAQAVKCIHDANIN